MVAAVAAAVRTKVFAAPAEAPAEQKAVVGHKRSERSASRPVAFVEVHKAAQRWAWRTLDSYVMVLAGPHSIDCLAPKAEIAGIEVDAAAAAAAGGFEATGGLM